LDNKIVEPDTSPKQVYDTHINTFGAIKYENFRRHWHRIKQQYLNDTAESIPTPFELHPPGYDPTQRVAPVSSPVARSPVAYRSASSNSTPSSRNVPPGKI
jgi:hypothetical protein